MTNFKDIPVQEAAERHAAGESLRSLARVYGVEPVTLSRKLKAAGFEVRSRHDATVAFNVARPPSLDPPPKEELERLYASGHSLYSLGDCYGVSTSTVKKWMEQYGLARRPQPKATSEANLRRPQGNMSRGGSGRKGLISAVRKCEHRKAAIIRRWKTELGCERCGETHPATLDLHHRDPTTKHPRLKRKNASASRRTGGYFWRDLSLDDLATELAKCAVLCSNCHRIVEWELRQEVLNQEV